MREITTCKDISLAVCQEEGRDSKYLEILISGVTQFSWTSPMYTKVYMLLSFV